MTSEFPVPDRFPTGSRRGLVPPPRPVPLVPPLTGGTGRTGTRITAGTTNQVPRGSREEKSLMTPTRDLRSSSGVPGVMNGDQPSTSGSPQQDRRLDQPQRRQEAR